MVSGVFIFAYDEKLVKVWVVQPGLFNGIREALYVVEMYSLQSMKIDDLIVFAVGTWCWNRGNYAHGNGKNQQKCFVHCETFVMYLLAEDQM